MSQSTNRLIISLSGLVFLLSSLYFYTTFISPQFVEIQELRSKQVALVNRFNEYEEAINNQDNRINEFKRSEKLQASLTQILPTAPNVPILLNQLYGLAELNNILIDSIEFQPQPLKIDRSDSLARPHRAIRAIVKASGSYEEMKNYLNSIEANVRLMRIVSINIGDGFKRDPVLSYVIAVEAYYLNIEK